MAEAKIDQKIPMNLFGEIGKQLKAEGIHVISQACFNGGLVQSTNVQGRVVSAFNLGAKIAVDVEPAINIKEARFRKLSDVYYLVLK